MTAAAALLASVAWGVADFLGGLKSRTVHVLVAFRDEDDGPSGDLPQTCHFAEFHSCRLCDSCAERLPGQRGRVAAWLGRPSQRRRICG